MTTDAFTTAATHDWHVGTDGMELMIRSDEADSVGVHLGHENIDDAHATTLLTSRLLEMVDAVQPVAIRDHLSRQEATDAEAQAYLDAFSADLIVDAEWTPDTLARVKRGLTAARKARHA